jgi:hypothetical protein
VKRLGTYAPPVEKFEPLSWQVLIPVLLAFALVVSPVALDSLPVLLSILLLAGLGAVSARVRALGMGLIGIPALLALLFQNGAATDKSWAALLAMLEFYALEQLIWGLEEETPQPWRASAVLWFFMPSALGLLGVLLIMLLSHARWQQSLSLARVAKKQSLRHHWVFIVLALGFIALISAFLPSPQSMAPTNLPTLLFSNGLKKVTPENPVVPDGITVPFAQSPVRDSKSTNWIGGSSFVLIFMVVYFFYVQKMLRLNASARGVKPKQSRFIWIWLSLFVLTGGVLVYTLFGLFSPDQQIKVQVDSSGSIWLALLFFMGLFVLWRIQKFKRGLVKAEKPRGDSDLEKLRYLAPKDAVRAAYFQWLVHLRDLEIRRGLTQTPLEFQGVVQNLHPALQNQTQILTEAYQRVRYGATPSQPELEAVLEALGIWQDHIATILPPEITPQMVSS